MDDVSMGYKSVDSPSGSMLDGQEMAASLEGACLNPYPTGLVNFLTALVVLLISVIAGVITYRFYLVKKRNQKKTDIDFDDIAKENADEVHKEQQDNVSEYENKSSL